MGAPDEVSLRIGDLGLCSREQETNGSSSVDGWDEYGDFHHNLKTKKK